MSDKHAWAQPGVYEVADGVYRIPLGMPTNGLRAVNIYALTDGDGYTVIDSGWPTPEARDQLRDALTHLGIGARDITQFLITHVHRDHYGIAAEFHREHGTRVIIGEHERPSLEFLGAAVRKPFTPQFTMLREAGAFAIIDALEAMVGAAAVDPADWPMPTAWASDRERFTIDGRTLETVATPGHTRGHVIYREPQQHLVFSGDHVLPQITPSIALEPAPPQLPLRDFLDSLRLVRELPDARMLPAHGPVTDSVHARVDELLAHHDNRLAEMAGKLTATGSSATAVAEKVGWTGREKPLAELDPFNAMLAVLETRAHLDLLVAQERAQVEKVDGVWAYRLVR